MNRFSRVQYWITTREGEARYAGHLQAPVEGFGLCSRIFLCAEKHLARFFFAQEFFSSSKYNQTKWLFVGGKLIFGLIIRLQKS